MELHNDKNIISFFKTLVNRINSFIKTLHLRKNRTHLIEIDKNKLLLKKETKIVFHSIGIFIIILSIFLGSGIHYFVTGESIGIYEVSIIISTTMCFLVAVDYFLDHSKNVRINEFLDKIRYEYYLFDKENNKLTIQEIFENFECLLSDIENVKVYIPPGWEEDIYPVYVYLKDGQKFSIMVTNHDDVHKEIKFQIVKRIQQFLELA